MNELTERLATGDHPVTVGGPQPSLEDLQYRIDEVGWIHVKFTDTRGGTDLGIKLDTEGTDLSKADWEKGTGSIHVEGNLTLNWDPVRLIADIDLSTLNGTGHLELREEPAEAAEEAVPGEEAASADDLVTAAE
jgi:Core binding factor beta subunit